MLQRGQRVLIHYACALDDGTVFIDTWPTQEPLGVTIGEGGLLPAFERELMDMKRGERQKFRLRPEDAFGVYDSEAMIEVPVASIPDAQKLSVGEYVEFDTDQGRIRLKVLEVGKSTVRFDCNHELAGQALNFEVELVEDGSADLVERETSAQGCSCGALREALGVCDHEHDHACC